MKGLMISEGMSRPGGQGREKLLSRYLPLIASSTSLSIKALANHIPEPCIKCSLKGDPAKFRMKDFMVYYIINSNLNLSFFTQV